MPKISLMIHTASPDNFLINQGINSYFESVIECLKNQTFKDFEFIYIDTYYDENKDKFASISCPFLVKHVPIHYNHRYWFDLGYTYISAAKNTGILYADGELVVTCDDAEFFPENLLQKYWGHYSTECYLFGVHKRLKSIKTVDGKIVCPISGDVYINDHRFQQKNSIICHNNGTWAYAGTSFALKDALYLNGFNEKMDGCKSLEDCDFGTRLSLLGRRFSLDLDAFIYILDHKSYGDMKSSHWGGEIPDDCGTQVKEVISKKKIDNFIAVENYGTLRCASELSELVVNKKPVGEKELKIIQRETLKYRGFDPLAKENEEKLKIWMSVPNFDLHEERIELRKNNWKW